MKNFLLIVLISQILTINGIPNLIGKCDNYEEIICMNSTMCFVECNNNGKFICSYGNEKSFLRFGKLKGNGSIIVKSGKLVIVIEKCSFEGLIECYSGCECEILTSTPISDLKLHKEGDGKIIINKLH